MNKAKCSRAGRNLAKRPSSQAGRALAECRWGKKKPVKKPAKKPAKKTAKKTAKKPAAPPRRSNRLAGREPTRQPEPPKKPRKKRTQKAPERSAASKKIENILVPGVNPKKGDMKNFLEQQRALWL